MTNKSDLLIILAVLGVAVFILWKSGIFKAVNTASDIASGAGETANTIFKAGQNVVSAVESIANSALTGANQLVNTASTGVNYVAGSIVNLPENLSELAQIAPEIPLAILHNIGLFPDVASPTERAYNIVASLRRLYPNLASDSDRVRASWADHITYDKNGNPIDANGNYI
jgi:hypothetical protein